MLPTEIKQLQEKLERKTKHLDLILENIKENREHDERFWTTYSNKFIDAYQLLVGKLKDKREKEVDRVRIEPSGDFIYTISFPRYEWFEEYNGFYHAAGDRIVGYSIKGYCFYLKDIHHFPELDCIWSSKTPKYTKSLKDFKKEIETGELNGLDLIRDFAFEEDKKVAVVNYPDLDLNDIVFYIPNDNLNLII